MITNLCSPFRTFRGWTSSTMLPSRSPRVTLCPQLFGMRLSMPALGTMFRSSWWSYRLATFTTSCPPFHDHSATLMVAHRGICPASRLAEQPCIHGYVRIPGRYQSHRISCSVALHGRNHPPPGQTSVTSAHVNMTGRNPGNGKGQRDCAMVTSRVSHDEGLVSSQPGGMARSGLYKPVGSEPGLPGLIYVEDTQAWSPGRACRAGTGRVAYALDLRQPHDPAGGIRWTPDGTATI